jgi:hypothetical protein
LVFGLWSLVVDQKPKTKDQRPKSKDLISPLFPVAA